jgi:hypothetical protein
MEMRACVVMETKQLRIHHDRVIIKTNLGILTVRQNSISKAFLVRAHRLLSLNSRQPAANQTEK